MLLDISIKPYDLLFLIIPLILAIFFYARSAKTERDRDKFILFILSIISITIWFFYTIKFFNEVANSLLYGHKY